MKYCYSLGDEEIYQGEFDTREAAQAEALMHIKDLGCDGPSTYWVAEIVPAPLLLDASHLGWQITEAIENYLSDAILSDDPVVSIFSDEMEELGQLVIDYLETVNGFKQHAVTGEQEHKVP
jgi:hypothetical protein